MVKFVCLKMHLNGPDLHLSESNSFFLTKSATVKTAKSKHVAPLQTFIVNGTELKMEF